jgi:O-antigen/teichoic acid export membrane protein
VLNVALNLTLIPKFGVLGAAMSTAAAFSMGAVMSWWFGRRLRVYPLGMRELFSMVLSLLAIIFIVKSMPTITDDGLFEASLRLIAGLTAFTVVALLTNLAGARCVLLQKLRSILIRGVQ